MQKFSDDEGREWTFNLTIDLAQEIYRRCERPDSTSEERKYYDLLSVTDPDQAQYLQPFQDGRLDPERAEKLVNLWWVILEKQCKERKVSELDFAKLLQGGTFGRCLEAFQSEVINFIPLRQYRETVQTIMNSAGGVDLDALASVNQRFRTLTTAKNAGISEALDIRLKSFESQMKQDLERLKVEAIEHAEQLARQEG